MNPFINNFFKIVEKHSNNIAITNGGCNFATYSELAHKAKILAGKLIETGFKPGDLAAISVEKSPEYLITLLAIWIVGGAFVPLDPLLPQARREFILKESKPKFILYKNNTIEILRDSIQYPIELAYIFFTSGSMGKPKGVMVPHSGIINVIEEQISFFQMNESCRSLFYLSTNFDASISDIGTTFLAGATLCIETYDNIQLTSEFGKVLKKNNITHLDIPPSLLSFLRIEDMPQTLKVVIIGGEICPVEVVRKWAEKYRLINVYGPTEATICTSMELCLTNWVEPVIGKPIANINYIIMDEYQQIAAKETPGELYISGLGLAIGYVNNLHLTSQKFLTINNQRYYRTGDLAKETLDGKYVYFGRIDSQFKIRGQLVAPEEIETVLESHPLVTRAAVIIQNDEEEKKKICAYVETQKLNINSFRDFIKKALPSWMIPHHIKITDKLPLNSNGKIDYLTIQSINFYEQIPKLSIDKIDDLYSKKLQNIWANILKLSTQPLTNEDFFDDLGGDSLTALEMLVACEFDGIHFPIGILFERRTIEELVTWLKSKENSSHLDFMSSEHLKKDIVLFPLNDIPISNSKHVFLTGATGYLGIHVLSEIQSHTDFHITCLVRAESIEQATFRLNSIASEFNIQLNMSKIHILVGDLSLEKFGLTERQWIKLSEEISAIYHCGAEVNMVKNYQLLKKVNLSGTVEVTKLAENIKKKTIHYASTLSVFVSTDYGKKKCFEEDNLENIKLIYGGYAQSKWAAEYFLRKMDSSNINIFRFGLITGHSVTGQFARHDYLSQFVNGIRKIGSIPKGDWSNLFLDCTPVNYAAKSMVYLSLLSQKNCYHIANYTRFSLAKIIDCLKKLEIHITAEEPTTWYQKTSQYSQTAPAYLALCRLVPKEDFFQRHRSMDLFQATDIVFNQTNTNKCLAGSGIPYRNVNNNLLEKYLERITNGI